MNRKLFCVGLALAFSWVTFGVRADDAESVFPKRGEEVVPKPSYIDSYVAYPQPESLANNSYLGFQLGYSGISFGGLSRSTAIKYTNAKEYKLGFVYGYGKTFSKFYLGIETQAVVNFVSGRNIFNYYGDANINNTYYTFNIDLHPGFLVSKNFLPYLILGVGGNFSGRFNKYTSDWRTGLGMDIFISDTFSIRGDYVYTKYFKATDFPSAHSNQVDLGFMWHF